MEFFKAFIAACLSPVVLALMLQLPGWLLLRKRRRLGLCLVASGTAALLLGSLGGWTLELRRSAQYSFPPADVRLIPESPVVIVVLGTGMNPDPELPANSQVGGAFLSRLIEGVRLLRARPDAELVVSIAGKASEFEKQKFWSAISGILLLQDARCTVLTTAESTLDEAELVRPLVQGKTVLLATSAAHISRAVRIFTEEGIRVIAAPTDFSMARKGTAGDRSWLNWLPSTDGLAGNQAWLYETVASLWQGVRGRLAGSSRTAQ